MIVIVVGIAAPGDRVEQRARRHRYGAESHRGEQRDRRDDRQHDEPQRQRPGEARANAHSAAAGSRTMNPRQSTSGWKAR